MWDCNLIYFVMLVSCILHAVPIVSRISAESLCLAAIVPDKLPPSLLLLEFDSRASRHPQ